MLDPVRPVESDEASVVGPIVALELHDVIEEAVRDGIDNPRAEPNQGLPGLFESSQALKISAGFAATSRFTVNSVVFISFYLRAFEKSFRGDPDVDSRIVCRGVASSRLRARAGRPVR